MTFSELRRRARVSLKDNWLTMTLISFINYILVGIFSTIACVGFLGAVYGIIYNRLGDTFINNMMKQQDTQRMELLKKTYGEDTAEIYERTFKNIFKACGDMVPVLVAICIIGIILTAIIGSMLTSGIYKCYYKVATGEEVNVKDLFTNIRIWPKMLIISLLRYGAMSVVYVAAVFIAARLGAVIFVLSGLPILFLVAMILIEFIMSPYILIDNPELGPITCLKSASNIVKGYRLKILGLTLSFIGWFLLYCLLAIISVVVLPVFVVLPYALYAVYQVYIYTTYTHYYLHITGQDAYMNVNYNQAYGYNNMQGQYGNGQNQFGNMQNQYGNGQNQFGNQNVQNYNDINNMNQQLNVNNSINNTVNSSNDSNNTIEVKESLESKADKLLAEDNVDNSLELVDDPSDNSLELENNNLDNSLDLVDDFIDFDV